MTLSINFKIYIYKKNKNHCALRSKKKITNSYYNAAEVIYSRTEMKRIKTKVGSCKCPCVCFTS